MKHYFSTYLNDDWSAIHIIVSQDFDFPLHPPHRHTLASSYPCTRFGEYLVKLLIMLQTTPLLYILSQPSLSHMINLGHLDNYMMYAHP